MPIWTGELSATVSCTAVAADHVTHWRNWHEMNPATFQVDTCRADPGFLVRAVGLPPKVLLPSSAPRGTSTNERITTGNVQSNEHLPDSTVPVFVDGI